MEPRADGNQLPASRHRRPPPPVTVEEEGLSSPPSSHKKTTSRVLNCTKETRYSQRDRPRVLKRTVVANRKLSSRSRAVGIMNWGWSEEPPPGGSPQENPSDRPVTASTGRRPGSSLRPGSRGGAGSEVASADAATAAAAALLEEQERQQCEQAQAQRPLVPQKRLGEGDGDIRTGGGKAIRT